MKNKVLRGIGIVIWVLAVLCSLYLVYTQTPQQSMPIEITADYVDETRIRTEGVFTITGVEGLTPEEMSSRLRIELGATVEAPEDDVLIIASGKEMEFLLTPAAEGEMTLRTYLPLPPGQEIAITLRSNAGAVQKEWKFLTEDAFHVIGSFPADGATDVPPSTAIEIQLSHQDVDVDEMKKYISLSIDLDFHIYRHNNTYILSTYGDMPAMSDVEVAVSADLPRENGDALGVEYRFSFQTGSENSHDFRLSSTQERVTENVLPGDDALLKIDLGRELYETPLTTTVYRYPDAQSYRKALESYRDALIEREYSNDYRRGGLADFWQADLTGLEEVMRFTAPAGTKEENTYERYVALPDKLEPGWYAATVQAELPSGNVATASKLIQVTPLSVFYAQPSRIADDNLSEVLAWVNDTETGGPVDGAEVRIDAREFQTSGETGADGIALLSGEMNRINRTGQNQEQLDADFSARVFGIFEVRAGERTFLEMYGDNSVVSFSNLQAANDYYCYLFSDRPVYRHNDTVKVWGLVRPRLADTPLPDELYVTIFGTDIKAPVTLSEDGAFLTEFDIEALSGNYATIQLLGDGGSVQFDNSLWVKLEDYVKPEYQTTSAVDQALYTQWDNPEVGIDFTAHYFEGTPAREYRAVARPMDNSEAFAEVPLTTDAEGKARVAIRPGEPEEYARKDWRPKSIAYGIYSDAELNAPQVQGGSFYYLYHDTMLELESGEDGASVTARVNRIDTSRVQTEADALVDENFRGAPADVRVEAQVHRVYYKKTPNGERYDAISKTAVTAFDYEYTDEVVDTVAGTSTGGVYTFTGLPKNDAESTYYVEVSLADSRGRQVAEQLYYGSRPFADMGIHRFKLMRKEPAGAEPVYAGDLMGQRFGDGETLDIYLTDQEEPYTDPEGSVLWVLAQDRFLAHDLAAVEGFRLPFDEDYLPNYTLSGAYFDGRYVHAIAANALVFNPEKRELDIAVTTDKEEYTPGDTVEIAFRVTEKESGAPAAGALLTAAVVDEAVFSIEEQVPDFLNKLYMSKYYGWIFKYTSHNNHQLDGGGKGGGGPENFIPRVDFPDTAAFEELITDQDGGAKLTVKIPDNMTSWRVTALAVTKDRKAGDTKRNFTVGKDFYVSPVLPPRLVQGDDLVVTVHSAGRAVQPDDTVTYRCTIEGMGEDYGTEAKAGDFTPIAFHSLPESLAPGSYNITVAGQWGSVTDAMTLPLEVVESGIDVSVSRKMPLAEAAGLESTSWPVTLGFYDREHALAADILSLLARQEGARVDQRMARRFAMEQMRDTGLEASRLDAAALSDDFRDLAPEYANYRLFPYAEESELLTARIRVAAPEEYYAGGSKYGPENAADDPSERVGTMLLESEYLNSIDSLIGELESGEHRLRDQIYLLLAVARAGDSEEAKARYDALVGPLLTESANLDGEPMLSVRRDGEADGEATAAASMLATALELESAEPLARYLVETPAFDDLYLLELLYYLRMNPLPEEASGMRVVYALDGAEQTADLRGGIAYRGFTKAQLAAANFRAEGDVWVNALYTAGMADALARDNQTLTLTKTVEAADGGVLRQGALAKITLTLEVPEGARLQEEARLRIEDYVPTGMRFESLQPDTGWYLLSRNGQRVAFTALYKEMGALTFYARCVAPGNYTVENAFASSASGSIWGASERGKLTIDP